MKLETFSLRCYPIPLRIRVILTSVLLLTLAAPAAAQLRKLNIAYTATSPCQNDFTADIVMTDGRPSAKVGRRFRPNARLELVP